MNKDQTSTHTNMELTRLHKTHGKVAFFFHGVFIVQANKCSYHTTHTDITQIKFRFTDAYLKVFIDAYMCNCVVNKQAGQPFYATQSQLETALQGPGKFSNYLCSLQTLASCLELTSWSFYVLCGETMKRARAYNEASPQSTATCSGDHGSP